MKIKKILIIFFLLLCFIILITNKTIETLDYNKVLKNYKINNKKYDFNIRKLYNSENANNIQDITNMEEKCNSYNNIDCLGDSNCGLYYKHGDSNGTCVLDNSIGIYDMKPYFVYPSNDPHIYFPHYDMNTGIYTKDGSLYETNSKDRSIFDGIKLSKFDFDSPSVYTFALTSDKIISKKKIPGDKVNIKYSLENNINYSDNIDSVVPILISSDGKKININNYHIKTDDNELIVEVKGVPRNNEKNHLFNLEFFKKFGTTLKTVPPPPRPP